MCAQRITEVIVSGMEAYTPHTFSPYAKKPWFNLVYSRAVKDREAASRRYLNLRTCDAHNLYISARNRARSILRLTKNSFINKKCQNLFNSNSSKYFWHLGKTVSKNFTSSFFPSLLKSDGTTAVTSISKVEPFS